MSETTKLLVVDDDNEIRELLAKFLNQYGYNVSTAADGIQMFKAMENQVFDLIILDLMMPGEDGLSLCRRVRTESDIPIIMLTAISEDTDKIIGLEVGADDYIPKPFNPRELLARIKAILRRTGKEITLPASSEHKKTSQRASFAGWQLNLATRRLVSPDDLEITLSAGEYDLLVAFIEHPQRVLSRDQLLDITKHRPAGPFDRSIDVQISRLRHKIEVDPKEPQIIKTVRSGGYLFTPEVTT